MGVIKAHDALPRDSARINWRGLRATFSARSTLRPESRRRQDRLALSAPRNVERVSLQKIPPRYGDEESGAGPQQLTRDHDDGRCRCKRSPRRSNDQGGARRRLLWSRRSVSEPWRQLVKQRVGRTQILRAIQIRIHPLDAVANEDRRRFLSRSPTSRRADGGRARTASPSLPMTTNPDAPTDRLRSRSRR